jgi:hypothetical protein
VTALSSYSLGFNLDAAFSMRDEHNMRHILQGQGKIVPRRWDSFSQREALKCMTMFSSYPLTEACLETFTNREDYGPSLGNGGLFLTDLGIIVK